MKNVAYIYKKDGKHKVYNQEKALIHHNSLIKNGYTHECTVDIYIWAEMQLNSISKKYEKSE